MAGAEKKIRYKEKDLTLYCDSCTEEGETNEAHSFCFDCEKYFCSSCEKLHTKFSRNHKTIEGNALPEARDLAPLMQCSGHARHSVEFYCEEHHSVFCRLCRRIIHDNCNVKDIHTVCEETNIETDELRAALDRLHSLTGQITDVKSEGQRQLEQYAEETKERKSHISVFKTELADLFDMYETRGDEYEQAHTERIKSVVEKMDSYLTQTEQQIRSLEETKDQLQTDARFVSLIKSNQFCNGHKRKVEDVVSDVSEHRPFAFHDEKMLPLVEKFSVLTRAEQPEHTSSDEMGQAEAMADMHNKSFWNIKACTLIKDADIRAVDGKKICIAVCCFMTNGEVILCDSTRRKMTLFNKTIKFICDINLKISPFDVAEVDEKSVAVTVPNQNKVQFVTIKPGLKFGKEFILDCECYGIVVHEKEIYICIKQTDFYGTVYGIQIRSDTLKLLKNIHLFTDVEPKYLCLSSDCTKIFLTGGKAKSPVVCITKEEHVVYMYFDDNDRSPANVFTDAEENLLVLYSSTTDSKNKAGIRVIKSGGEYGKDLLPQEKAFGNLITMHINKNCDILLVASEYATENKTATKLSHYAGTDENTTTKLSLYKLEYS